MRLFLSLWVSQWRDLLLLRLLLPPLLGLILNRVHLKKGWVVCKKAYGEGLSCVWIAVRLQIWPDHILLVFFFFFFHLRRGALALFFRANTHLSSAFFSLCDGVFLACFNATCSLGLPAGLGGVHFFKFEFKSGSYKINLNLRLGLKRCFLHFYKIQNKQKYFYT